MSNSSGWLQGIQYFRAIAIIEVITFHVFAWGAFSLNPLLINIVVSAFTNFGVPHFIFISGVVLYNKYHSDFSLSKFYKKRFSAVVPPYLVWITFYLALDTVFFFVFPTIYTYIWQDPIIIGNPAVVTITGSYVRQLIIGYRHLWFIVILVELYLLYPLFQKMYNHATRQRHPIYILSLILLVQIGYTFVTPSLWIAQFFRFLPYIFYFVFGFFIAQYYATMKRKVASISLKSISFAVLLFTAIYVVVYYNDTILNQPLPYYDWLNLAISPFYCLLLILFYLKICTTWGDPRGFFLQYVEKIGEDSFGIFLVHWFFTVIFICALLALGLRPHDFIFSPVVLLLTIVSSYLAVQAIYRLPFSNIIIGKPRKEKSKPPRVENVDAPTYHFK